MAPEPLRRAASWARGASSRSTLKRQRSEEGEEPDDGAEKGKGAVRVAALIRPLLDDETARGEYECVRQTDAAKAEVVFDGVAGGFKFDHVGRDAHAQQARRGVGGA